MKLYCILLYCRLLCCMLLYCILLYCILLCCMLLYCILLYCSLLFCMLLYCMSWQSKNTEAPTSARECTKERARKSTKKWTKKFTRALQCSVHESFRRLYTSSKWPKFILKETRDKWLRLTRPLNLPTVVIVKKRLIGRKRKI